MLACDLILEVRASGSLSAEQVRRLECMAFGGGQPSREQLEILLLIDRYVVRADPGWATLLARAAEAVRSFGKAANGAAGSTTLSAAA